MAGREGAEVGLAGNVAAHAADGVFDAALLPGRVGVAEVGLDVERMQFVVAGELGAVVEGDGLAEALWQRRQQAGNDAGDGTGGFTGQADGDQQARSSFMQGEDGLPVAGEHHQVGFPVACDRAVFDVRRPPRDRHPGFDMERGRATLAAPEASFALAARQVAPPAIILGARDLGMNEAVDAFR